MLASLSSAISNGGVDVLGRGLQVSQQQLRHLLQRFISASILFYGSTVLSWALAAFSVGRTSWMGHQLPIHRTTQTQNRRTQIETSLPWVGFETRIPAFERAKRVSCLRPRDHCDRTHISFTMWNLWRPWKSSDRPALASKDCTFRCGSIASRSSKIFSL
jgi:hypothetical protein